MVLRRSLFKALIQDVRCSVSTPRLFCERFHTSSAAGNKRCKTTAQRQQPRATRSPFQLWAILFPRPRAFERAEAFGDPKDQNVGNDHSRSLWFPMPQLSMRMELTTRSLEDLQRSREYRQACAEEKRCFLDMEEEAWELSRSQTTLGSKTRKEFEGDFKRNVMPGPFRDSKEDQKVFAKSGRMSCAGKSTEEGRRLERKEKET